MMSPGASSRCDSSDTRSPPVRSVFLPSLPGARQAYTNAARKGRIRGIKRPKVLLVGGHPSIGAALDYRGGARRAALYQGVQRIVLSGDLPRGKRLARRLLEEAVGVVRTPAPKSLLRVLASAALRVPV